MQRLLSLFLAALSTPTKSAAESLEVNGTPDSVERMTPRDVGDGLATFGWKAEEDGTVRLFVSFFTTLIVAKIVALKMRFNKGIDYEFGAISRTQVGDKIMTIVSATPGAYAKNSMIFSGIVARLARIAGFDGVYRNTGSNALNLATRGPTNDLYLVKPNGTVDTLPAIPGATEADTIVHAVDPTNGMIILAKRGDTDIYGIDLNGDILTPTKVMGTKSPVEDISAYAPRTGTFFVSTKNGIETVSPKGDQGYERTSEEIIDGFEGYALLGVSASGGINVTQRDSNGGGKTTVYVVPKTLDLGETVTAFDAQRITTPPQLEQSVI